MPASFLPPKLSRASAGPAARTAAAAPRTGAAAARVAAGTALAVAAAGAALVAATAIRPAHAQPPSATNITVNASAKSSTAGANRVYDGVGGVLAGGANARYLMDYPEPERSQLLDYLFKPDYGASLQMLKLEVGGDANSTDGSEPSIEPVKGQVNCDAGFEMSIAQRAVARNPGIVLYGLQWTAPSWVNDGSGSIFTSNDIRYLLDWLGCAKRRGLTIRYLGGWNENDDGTHGAWFGELRSALNAHGYAGVKLIAGDDFANPPTSTRPWEYISDPDIVTLGAHDICGYPTGTAGAGTTCQTTPAALRSGKPLWASELGGNSSDAGPGCAVRCATAMTRSIVRGYVDARLTGYLEWPVLDAMPAGLPYETAGLVTADQPWSGNYTVDAQTWAIAHFTQFAPPGWHYLDAASGFLQGNRADGSYSTLVSPAGNQWSSIIEATAGVSAAQQANFTVTGGARGLAGKTVHVWASNFSSGSPADWFVHQQDIRPSGGKFSLTIQPGYVYTLTTTTGQGKGTAAGRRAAPLPLPYRDRLSGPGRGAGYDNEPELLAAQDGSFELAPCRVANGSNTTCTQQDARPVPVVWRYCDGSTNAAAGTACRYPYATVGDPGWTNYTVSSDVLFSRSRSSAGLIGRFSSRAYWEIGWFNGYLFDVSSTGAWKIIKNSSSSGPATLASGTLATAPGTGSWHRLSMTLAGSTITADVDGHPVGSVTDSSYTSGQAGVEAGAFTSEWPQIQYSNLSVTAPSTAASATPSSDPPADPAARALCAGAHAAATAAAAGANAAAAANSAVGGAAASSGGKTAATAGPCRPPRRAAGGQGTPPAGARATPSAGYRATPMPGLPSG